MQSGEREQENKVRELFFNRAMTRFPALFLLAAALVLLAACSDNTGAGPTTATTTTPPAAPSGLIALSTSMNSILSDNATAATLTATVVDTSNAVMAGVVVSFSATTGSLSASQVTTDANGEAKVLLKSGALDVTNRIATVTATVGAQSASVPILITGSTLALTLTSNNIVVGAGTIGVEATAANASGTGQNGHTIRFSISTPDTGAGTLSAATLATNVSGIATPLTFTPTADGTVVLTAEWLNSAGAVTVTTTQNIFVTAAAGIAFAITTPATDPIALTSAALQPLVVTVPATISGAPVANLRISASSGSWMGASLAPIQVPVVTGPSSSILQTPSAGAVAATYTAPLSSGSVTVQVEALDASGNTLSSLMRTFLISAPSTAASKLFLSPVVSTLIPSTNTFSSTTKVEATVRDVNNNAVGGAAVMFGLLGTTGSGESVSPAVAITDSYGHASSTFTAGTGSTLATIHVQGSVVGQACTFSPSPLVAETNGMCDAAPIIVSATAVSVIVGFGSEITSTALNTIYQLPGSVLVVDANGTGVPGIPVTLTVFPVSYTNSVIYADNRQAPSGYTLVPQCVGPYFDDSLKGTLFGTSAVWVGSEDVNRNGIMDPLEDVNGNGVLSPGAAAGGAIPLTVTTDTDGYATFMLTYPKSSAWLIEDEVTARVLVDGTESYSRTYQVLPMSITDKFDPVCVLGHWANY